MTNKTKLSVPALSLFAASFLAACSTPMTKPVASPNTVAQVQAATQTEPPATASTASPSTALKPTYPGAKLSADLLYELMLAEIAVPRGQIPTAVAALLDAAKKTSDPRLAERATSLALYGKDVPRGLAAGALWIKLQPDNVEAHQTFAEILLQAEQFDAAKEQFLEVLRITDSANRGPAYLKMAAALARLQDRGTALGIMRSLVDSHPEVRESHFALAHLTVRMGDLAAALQAINQALSLSPGWEEAAVFKARVLVSQKDHQGALAFFNDYLKTYPRATSLRLNYARFLIDLKQWDQARLQFKQVTSESPQDADAIYAVGLLALQANQFTEAKQYLQRNLELQPDNDQARIYLGQVAEQERNYDEAERWYRSVEGDALEFEAQARLALVKATRGDIAAARAQLHTIQPGNDQQRVQLALSEDQILREAHQYEESFKVLTAAVESMPDSTDLLYARALVAEKLNRIDVHEADLRKVLQKDPKNAHALNALGYTLADRTTRYDEAVKLLEQAIALKPDDPFIIDSMGWVQYRMGNSGEAIRLLRRALGIRNDAEISAHLGEVLWVTGDRAQAESVWRDALQATPDNEALLSIIKKFKP